MERIFASGDCHSGRFVRCTKGFCRMHAPIAGRWFNPIDMDLIFVDVGTAIDS